MTETELRQKTVNEAYYWKPAPQGGTRHQELVECYNKIRPLPRGYTMKLSDAWCAAFVSVVMHKCGMADIAVFDPGCYNMMKGYISHGRSSWVNGAGYRPKAGDIIMFNWAKNPSGVPDHVGFVAKVEGNTLTCIEGNISKNVGERTLQIGDARIRGYCLPNYASMAVADSLSTSGTMGKFDPAGIPKSTGDNPSPWAKDATAWAKANGLFLGDAAEPPNFGWQEPITREEVAIVLQRLAASIAKAG